MNLKMRLKDEWKLGLSEGLDQGRAEGKTEGRDEMTLGLIHALQAQGMPQKQIIEALALARKISLAEAQHYYEQVTQAANESAH